MKVYLFSVLYIIILLQQFLIFLFLTFFSFFVCHLVVGFSIHNIIFSYIFAFFSLYFHNDSTCLFPFYIFFITNNLI